jgi:hypothetical protein
MAGVSFTTVKFMLGASLLWACDEVAVCYSLHHQSNLLEAIIANSSVRMEKAICGIFHQPY